MEKPEPNERREGITSEEFNILRATFAGIQMRLIMGREKLCVYSLFASNPKQIISLKPKLCLLLPCRDLFQFQPKGSCQMEDFNWKLA